MCRPDSLTSLLWLNSRTYVVGQRDGFRIAALAVPLPVKFSQAAKWSIPVLISQLTETTRTEEPILDFWPYTTSGDVAFMFLNDLFTDIDGESSTISGVPNWKEIMSGCDGAAEDCWRKYLRKRGIRSRAILASRMGNQSGSDYVGP